MNLSCRATVIRALVFLAIVFAAAFSWWSLWREYPNAREGLYSRRIDSYLPDLGALGPELLRSGKESSRFLAYYHLIERQSMGTAGVNEMLGYCYYYSGNARKAVEYFERALRSAPGSFIARYNLGVIYFRKKDLEKALVYFQQAVGIPEGLALSYVVRSKVFSQFRVVRRIAPRESLLILQAEYGDAKRFIRTALEQLGRTRDLFFLGARYNDLRKVWAENGGAPFSTELIIF
ncbi:MAG: tetratricopeptide repeat protein [Candidatus Omnitrophica bacterium]|nr:tetratricopeptide repeat protein [Candidatus Omnitrophota bacterium]